MTAWLADATVARLRRAVEEPDLEGTRYELGERLGEGGMGTVYRARDRELGRDVAIKVLHAASADVPGLAARLAREARVLAQLEHPGVVPVHEAGTLADGRVFYAMRLVRGRRLDEVATATSLDERLRVFLRVAETVAYAHAHGVVHRDLKPENVMVGAFGEVLVMDWGLARVLADAEPAGAVGEGADPTTGATPEPTAHGTVLGTPGYMAPEQAAGDVAATGPGADVFALGGMLHFLAAGTPPDDGSEAGSPLPRTLAAIRDRARASDPARRYPTVAALAADVQRFLSASAVDAYREGPLERAWRLAVKHRTPLLLVLGYLVVRILLAAWTGR